MGDFLNTLKGIKSGETQAESGSGGGGSIKALKIIMPIEKVEAALKMIHEKTNAGDLELAMDLIFHKNLSKSEYQDVCMIVTVLRCGLQGDLHPEGYSPHDHYKQIIVGKPSNDGLSSGLTL